MLRDEQPKSQGEMPERDASLSDCAANTAPDLTDYVITNPNKRNICPAERRLATMVFAFHFRLAPILRGSCLPLLSSLAGALSEN